MQHDIQLSNNNSKELISFEQLKKQVLLESEKKHKESIVSYLKENKNSLLSVHKFLDDYSGELTDDLIMEKLTDDAKHLLQDIADSKEKCYLGLYKIKEIEKNNLYNTKYFWNWAETVTTINPYTLQNPKLDLILVKSIKESKGKFIDDKFNDVILITQNNASSNSLKVFYQLLMKLKSKFDEIDNSTKRNIFKEDDAKFSNRKEECRNEIIQQVSQIFESINHIVEHHARNNSYEFYFEMNPEEIEQICKISKEFKTDNTKVLWLEPLLNNLISYYVTVAKEFSLTADIGSLCDNWKLTKIFNIVYDYSNNNELQEKILDSFSVNNAFLPFLPLDIIESTFNQKDDIKQGNIIYYLEQRYDLSNKREKNIIISLNDKIILDTTKNIELREKAFSWIYDKTESKDSLCQSLLPELLENAINSDFELKPSFTQIIKKCFTAIQDKNSINNSITKYIAEGKNTTIISFFNDEMINSTNNSNAINQIQDIVLQLIKTAEAEKTIELCKYITKMSELGSLDSLAGRKGLEFICNNYELSEYQNEINECIRKIYIQTNNDESKIKFITEILQYIKDLKNTFIFSNMVNLFREENSEELNFLLLKEFFESKLPKVSIQELEKYINYIWNRKSNNQAIVDSILESICESDNKDLIRYVVLKGWRK